MKTLALLAVGLGLLGTFVREASAVPPATVFILDCSRSMAQPLDRTGERATQTRFEAAKAALVEALDKLAVDGSDQAVGVWLFGHRLAWEADSNQPDLLEQTAYLEHTLSFTVLATLLPGDDVELVRPVRRIDPNQLTELTKRLDVVKPWGEDPLYLSIKMAIENIGKPADEGHHRIVVLTDRGNEQGMCKFKVSKDQVLEAVDKIGTVELSVIVVGDEELPRQQESELRLLTRKSGGILTHGPTSDVLAVAIDRALKNETEPQPIVAGGQKRMLVSADPDQRLEQALKLFKEAIGPREGMLDGRVTFYGKPVAKARIALETEVGASTTATAADGTFKLTKLAPGKYTLRVESVLKNRIRDHARTIIIREGDEANEFVDVVLE